MLLLDCTVFDLAAPGFKRKAGEYLCQTERGEVVGVTRDHQPQMVRILGAGPYPATDRAAFEIIVDGRESCPLLLTGDSELYVFPGGMPAFWPVHNLSTGFELWLPEGSLGKRLSHIKQIRRVEITRYHDSECNALQLLLRPRGIFACVSGFCR
jgi:hypothetical protein